MQFHLGRDARARCGFTLVMLPHLGARETERKAVPDHDCGRTPNNDVGMRPARPSAEYQTLHM